ncbi:alkaline phosphatase PhoX, partial [Nonomuraea sp. SBT364]|uniref:alkaline phosphatase PhoX n=1 Tax=Nonomuraea sp. SBT364 TaxID=1580530 RepID=UPI00066BE2AD
VGARVVARSGGKVAGLTWHQAPGAGACFPDGPGWIYVSNAALPVLGGASAVRFRADGAVGAAYRILSGTEVNRGGGATPWHTWLSCELGHRGRVFECDPYGVRAGRPRLAMGRFAHGAAACDPGLGVVYLTEAERDGCFYRFRPGDWGDLTEGTLEVLCGSGGWERVPSPAALIKPARHQVAGARRFDGGDACHYAGGVCFLTTRGDGFLWAYDTRTSVLERVCDGVRAVTSAPSGDLYVARHGAGTGARIDVVTPDRELSPFLALDGDAELTGPAFGPGGDRLYFSATAASGESTTYEVTGPFRD